MWRGRNREGAVRQVSFSRLGFRPCRAHTPISLAGKAVCRITEIGFIVGLLPPAHTSRFTYSFDPRVDSSQIQETTKPTVFFWIKKSPPYTENGPELALGPCERGGGECGISPR
jgi:hypothetical protein